MWNLFAIPDYLLLFTFTLATIFVHLLNILCSLYLCCNIGGTVLIFVLISMHLLLFDIGSFLLSFSKTLYISSTLLIKWEILTSKFENGLFGIGNGTIIVVKKAKFTVSGLNDQHYITFIGHLLSSGSACKRLLFENIHMQSD